VSTEAAALEELQSAGLVFPDGSLTQRGEFEANLADYQFSDQELTTFRDFYDRGLILEDLSQTEEGRIFGMSREEVLDEGEETFARWYKLGGWEEHTDEIAMRDPETGERLPFIAGPTSKSVVSESIKGLATEVIPSAVQGAGLMARSMKPDFLSKIDDTLGKVTLFDLPILAPIYPGAALGYVERKAREKAGLTLDEFNELADDLALATSGKLVAGMARNQVWLARGIELQEAFLAKKMMGDSEEAEDAYIKALFNFEKGLQEIEDLDAAEGMMMGQAFLDIFKPFDDRTEDEKLSEIARVGELVRTKRERFDDDTLEEFEKHQDNLSQFVEISAPITPLASVGLRLGASTAKKGMKISKEIAKKQAQLSMTQRMIDRGAFATPYVRKGETVLPTGSQGLKTRAAKLTEEIGALNQKAGKIDAQTGVAGAVKDAARNAGYATRNWFAGTKMGQGLAVAARKGSEFVDDSPRLAKGLRTITRAGRYGGFAVAAGGGGLAMLGSGGALAPIAGLAVGLGTLPARYNILRAAFLTMRDMGAEALRRKGSMPYWKRVAEDTSKNALARKGALAMDLFRVPARVASRGAEAAAKGIIAETPFSMIGGLHLGAEAWAADAISEGVVLGSPGIVRGMVYGAGGMPAVAKKAEFDKLAMADAAEMRRNLDGQAQQDAFDRLPRDIRRQLGVYSAVFPDIDWYLDTEGVDSSWDKHTGKLTIAVNSADPLGALIGHEVAHSLHDRGLADLVVEELVGDGGALRMTKEQYLRARRAEQDQARVNEKGEVVLPSEAQIVAERDARRTDEEGVIVIPTDPDEAGLGDTMPDVLPLTPEAQEFKRRYEERSGELLDEPDLALEYFADTVGASLSRSRQKLQEYAQRNPIVRGLVDGVFNKFAFGREFLLRSGVMFDRYGNPIKGQGVLGVFQQSPSLSRVVETYLRENTGRLPENVPDSAAKRAREKADILTTEEEQAAIKDNIVDYVTDKDGNVKFLPDGTPVGWDEETWKARQTAGKTIIQEIAEKYGVSGVIFKNGERSYRLTRTQWDEVLRKLSESGWYNRVQLKIFEQMIDAVQREDGDQFLLHYHPVYSTDRRGGKRVPRNGRFSKLKKGVPYDITVSSKGNMLFRVVDVDKLANNAEKAFNTKLGQQLYNNTRDIMNDLETLAKNHKAGKSNVDHFGSQDRVNFLNAIMGILNKEHEAKNPLFEQPVFRNFRNKTNATDSVRLDRINRARIGRTQALPFRFDEWRKNMMPGPADAANQQSDAQADDIRRMPAKPEWVGNPPTFFDPAEPVVSVENQPGFNSQILRGLHTASKSVQRAFFQEIEEALAHDKSGDVIAHEMGLAGLLGPEGLKTAEPAPSVYVNKSGKVEVNQAVQVGGFVSQEAAELYALIRGYYTYQEAVAGYNPVEGGDKAGAQYRLGRALKTKGEVTGVMQTIKKELREAGIKQRKAAEDFAFYPTPEGFRLVHLGFNEAITPAIRDAAFDAVMEYVNLDAWGEFDTDTFYEFNNWTTEDIEEYGEVIKAAPGGEYFRQAIREKAAALGRPNILTGVDRRVGTNLQGVYEKYSEALGLGRPGRQPARRFKDQGSLKQEEIGPEAIPVRYKTHRTGERVLDKDGKFKPIEVPYRLTEGPFVDEPHPAPRDSTIDYLEDGNRHYELTDPAKNRLRELAENGSIDHAADLLVEEATRALEIPEIASGLGWYSRMREKLGGALGDFFDIFTQFLGATSAKTPVETNFSQSVDVLDQYQKGKFEETIPAYLELRSAMKEGIEATRELLIREGIKPKGRTLSTLGDDYIEAKNLMPRQHNGALFNSNGNAVLKVLAGVWFQEVEAPKTPQFAMNLFGTSLRATIDVWAARTLRRIFHRGTQRWRIQPESETGVNNIDFALGQMVFARAAERLKMSPDDLQALIWFAEKDIWSKNGWTGEIGAFKGSFDAAAEVYFPAGRGPRRLDHARNIMTFLQKRRLVEHDDTLPPAQNKKEADLRKNHEKELRKAETQPGVQEWLVEAGTEKVR
tara:strand:+ start:7765 stop:13788 length:6024 start_codon:yes stop_codon:yes gene_type:complete